MVLLQLYCFMGDMVSLCDLIILPQLWANIWICLAPDRFDQEPVQNITWPHFVVSYYCLIYGLICRSDDRFGHVIWPLPASSSRMRKGGGKGAGPGRRRRIGGLGSLPM